MISKKGELGNTENRPLCAYTNSQAWISTIINVSITAVSTFVPMSFIQELGISVVDFIINLALDGIFNYQNGHLWGI